MYVYILLNLSGEKFVIIILYLTFAEIAQNLNASSLRICFKTWKNMSTLHF